MRKDASLSTDKVKVVALGSSEIIAILLVPYFLFWSLAFFSFTIGLDLFCMRGRYLKIGFRDRCILIIGFLLIAFYYAFNWYSGELTGYFLILLPLLWFIFYTKITELVQICRLENKKGSS